MGKVTGNETLFAERRRHPRFADNLQVFIVEVGKSSDFHYGRLLYLSVDGLRLEVDRTFVKDANLYVGIFVQDTQEPLVVLGVVEHCAAEKDTTVLGVQLLSQSVEQRDAIERLRRYVDEIHKSEQSVGTA